MKNETGFCMSYDVFRGIRVGTISFVVIFVVSGFFAIIFSPFYWFLLLIYIFPLVAGFVIYQDSSTRMPDAGHIDSKNTYTFFDDKIMVKRSILFIPVWVWTEYHGISLEEFVNEKIKLQADHASKGTNEEILV